MEYSDPKRESDPYALPDVEVFQVPEDYGLEPDEGGPYEPGWYYWFCLPGCLPDSDPYGPFDSYGAALDDARENAGVYDEDES